MEIPSYELVVTAIFQVVQKALYIPKRDGNTKLRTCSHCNISSCSKLLQQLRISRLDFLRFSLTPLFFSYTELAMFLKTTCFKATPDVVYGYCTVVRCFLQDISS